MKCVLAGTYAEFKRFITDHDLIESQHCFGESIERMAGQSFDDIIVVGTFHRRSDSEKLLAYAGFIRAKSRPQRNKGIRLL